MPEKPRIAITAGDPAGIGPEIAILYLGLPEAVPELVVGRVLGLLDGVALLVLNYWYGTSAKIEDGTKPAAAM